jgi:hypothetical protein
MTDETNLLQWVRGQITAVMARRPFRASHNALGALPREVGSQRPEQRVTGNYASLKFLWLSVVRDRESLI